MGIVVYSGLNCKIMKNAKDPVTKYSSVEKLMNQALIESLKSDRDRCMQTANVTDKDLVNFKKKQSSKDVNQKEIGKMSETEQMAEEYFEYEDALQQAREKLKK